MSNRITAGEVKDGGKFAWKDHAAFKRRASLTGAAKARLEIKGFEGPPLVIVLHTNP